MKYPIKYGIILIFTIFLTFGLSVSLESLLAAWTAPGSTPVAGNANPLLYASSSAMQYITGPGTNGGDITVTGDMGVWTLTTGLSTTYNLQTASTLYTYGSASTKRVIISSNAAPNLVINNDNTSISDNQIALQLNGSTLYSFGLDDSDMDSFKISRNNILGVNDALTVNATGSIDLLYNDAFPTQLDVVNTYTTAPQDAQIGFGFGASNVFTMGIDESDGGKFKISNSPVLGTNDYFVINGNGNIGIGSAPDDSKGSNGYLSVKDAYLRDYGRWASAGGGSACNWSGWLSGCPADPCSVSCCGCDYSASPYVFLNFYCSGGVLTGLQYFSCTYGACIDCGGGGTTPYLFTQINNKYYLENDFMSTFFSRGELTPRQTESAYINNELGQSFKSKDIYKLKLKPDQEDGKIKLLIREIEPEESNFDKIQLLKVIHEKNSFVFADRDSIEAAKTEIKYPYYCREDNGKDCMEYMSGIDNKFVQKEDGGSMVLKFKAKKSDNYIMISSWGNEWLPKAYDSPVDDAFSGTSIIYFYYKNNQWNRVANDFHPRSIKSSEYEKIPVDKFINENNILTLKIEWTDRHNIDQVSLISGRSVGLKTEELNLTKAVHSNGTDVTDKINKKDYVYGHTVKGDSIKLEFETGNLDPKENEIVDYFFVVQGFYHGLRTYLYPEIPTDDSYIKEVDEYVEELNDYIKNSGIKYRE